MCMAILHRPRQQGSSTDANPVVALERKWLAYDRVAKNPGVLLDHT